MTLAIRLAERNGRIMSFRNAFRAPRFCWFSALGALVATGACSGAAADSASDTIVRMQEVNVNSTANSALTQAPAEARLDEMQPQSSISLPVIANSLAPSADYSMIANLAPSVTGVQSNGPGLGDAKNVLRGFVDGQYNMTFDGIPFGDSNSFTHHSTNYFPAKIIGRVVVDRGPGTPSTIGQATFGGTIALFSKDPRSDEVIVPSFSYGSYNTAVANLEVNTGEMARLGGASLLASYNYMTTDGFRSGSLGRRSTLFVKYLQPLGKTTTLTFLTTYNNDWFGVSNPVTQAQIDQYGRNYGLSNDPTRTDYTRYSHRSVEADMDYIGIASRFDGGWALNDKAYSYYYANRNHLGPIKYGTTFSPTQIQGIYQLTKYRAFGDTFDLSREDRMGKLKVGFWYEYQRNPRYEYKVAYTADANFIDYNPASPVIAAQTIYPATDYNMVNFMKTLQPFVEYEWHATSDLSVIGGVRYAYFERDLEAPVNQTSRLPAFVARKDHNTMPSLQANYRLASDWSVYGQISKGFLAPNLQLLYVPDPTKNAISPQETVNYQAGTVYKTDRLNADFDVYLIDYKNFPLSFTDPVTKQPYYTMASGARYSGVEAEATYELTGGLSLYANGSLNRAYFKRSHLQVQQVPQATALLGFVYNRGAWFGSLLDKYSGNAPIYDATGFNPDVATTLVGRTATGGYWMADAAIGYAHATNHFGAIRNYRIKLQVDNVLNRQVQVIDSLKSKVPFYNVLPGINYYVTVATEF
jgi:iron complex outermembrane receptor protein